MICQIRTHVQCRDVYLTDREYGVNVHAQEMAVIDDRSMVLERWSNGGWPAKLITGPWVLPLDESEYRLDESGEGPPVLILIGFKVLLDVNRSFRMHPSFSGVVPYWIRARRPLVATDPRLVPSWARPRRSRPRLTITA